jgi:uncharacterized membrane protein YwaF
MVIFGIISGILTLLFPLDLLKESISTIEIIRFFFAHLTIFMTPLLMLSLNIYKPTKKWIKHTLLILILMLNIAAIDLLFTTYLIQGNEGINNLLNY